MPKSNETLLEEIRRIRHELDEEMKEDPNIIHKLAQEVKHKHHFRTLKSKQQEAPGKKPSRGEMP